MHSLTTFAAFLSASILLAITPGPGILYVLTRSLAGGRREGIFSSLGTFVGGFAHVVAAGLGVWRCLPPRPSPIRRFAGLGLYI